MIARSRDYNWNVFMQACFAGGLYGLGSRTLKNQYSEKYMEVAEGITNTCHESYIRSYTRLGPESFR